MPPASGACWGPTKPAAGRKRRSQRRTLGVSATATACATIVGLIRGEHLPRGMASPSVGRVAPTSLAGRACSCAIMYSSTAATPYTSGVEHRSMRSNVLRRSIALVGLEALPPPRCSGISNAKFNCTPQPLAFSGLPPGPQHQALQAATGPTSTGAPQGYHPQSTTRRPLRERGLWVPLGSGDASGGCRRPGPAACVVLACHPRGPRPDTTLRRPPGPQSLLAVEWGLRLRDQRCGRPGVIGCWPIACCRGGRAASPSRCRPCRAA